MTRIEFQTIVDEICGLTWGHNKEVSRDCLSNQWVIGGITGGNCWDNGGHYKITPDKEPEFRDLDKLLETVMPTLSFLTYKKIDKLVEYRDVSGGDDCYGNYTNCREKTLSLDKLYELLFPK